MKKQRSTRKLTLNTETIRHLKELTKQDLHKINGGSDDTHTAAWWCTSTLPHA